MNVVLERDCADGPETAVQRPEATAAVEQLPAQDAYPDPPAADAGPRPAADAGPPPGADGESPLAADGGTPPPAESLAMISAAVQELASSAERYHARAQQREGVIDHLRSEVDRLRRGERRGLLRPLLVEICRLRADLLRQADGLPADFDAARAGVLLRSYAESVELALENSGVVTFEPDSGDRFDPRMHRRVGAEPTSDPALAGRVARIRRSGYLDVDANSPIALAEVLVFAAVSCEAAQPAQAAQAAQPGQPDGGPSPVTADPEASRPASSAEQRDEL
jgi:molecular chaperone GrpE